MHLKNIIESRHSLIFRIVLIISLTTSYAISYTGIQFFVESEPGGNYDAITYLSMYNSKIVHGHWRYRLLTPSLARVLPDLPSSLFNDSRVITDFWIAKVKFDIINFLFLSTTGILLFYFLLSLDLSFYESLIGILLFYTARPVIQSAGAPMVEASAYFFLILCLYAIRLKNLLLLTLGFSIGLFAKETTFLILPVVFFSELKNRIKAIFLLFPGIAIYLIFRFYIHPDSQENYFHLKYILSAGPRLCSLIRFNKAVDLFSSFGLLWIPVIYALINRKGPTQILRWSYLFLFLLGMIFLLGFNLGRILFYAFPVVIPLALYGMRSMLGKTAKN